MSDDQALWTVQIRGGKPFTLQVEGNPILEHNGRDSVCHMMISGREAEQIRGLISEHGAKGAVRRVAGATEKQREVKALLDEGMTRVWPCAKCPECPWLDPRLPESPCGRQAWDAPVVEDLIGQERWGAAAEACPVPMEG